MIRGIYLRERKAIKVKRRIKLLVALTILLILYKIIFSSYSLYESEASSNAEIDVAFYVVDDNYETKTITLDDMLPGDTQYCKFSIANFYKDGNNKEIVSETDMKCDLKIRTTTNLPLKYELYIDQDINQGKTVLDTEQLEKGHWDEYDTIFKYLVNKNGTDEEKEQGVTDTINFSYAQQLARTYILKITFPEDKCKDYVYSNIMECIEITVDSHQLLNDE